MYDELASVLGSDARLSCWDCGLGRKSGAEERRGKEHVLGTGLWAITGRVEEQALTSLASFTRAVPIKLKLPPRATLLVSSARWSKCGFEMEDESCVWVVPECVRDVWLGVEG